MTHDERKPPESETPLRVYGTEDQLRLLGALTAIQQRYLADSSVNLFDLLLDEALRTTESGFGFITEVLFDPDGSPYLRALTLTDISWDESSRVIFGRMKSGGVEFRNLNTLFGHGVRNGTLVISDDPAHDPRAGGTPAGHPPMTSFMGMPFFHRGRLTGFLGLANRPGGYHPSLAELLTPLLASCAAALESQRGQEARRRSTHESLASAIRLSTLVENLQEGLLLESEHRRIVLVNPRFCELFHIPVPPELMVGMDCSAMAEQSREAFVDPDGFVARIDEVLAGRRLVRGDVLTLRDGRVLERDFVPLDANGEYRGHYWQYRDITARKRSEEALVAARDAAELANRFKSDFLAGMSHEIRTPMTAIVGYADMLLRSGGSAVQWEDAIRQIRKNADYLLALVNDVLDLSKIEAGQLIVHIEPTQPTAVLAAVESMMRPLATEKCLSLDVELANAVPAQWGTDPVRFRQILVNLVGNAIKFTEQGGVKIICRYESETEGGRAGWLSFVVRDTGIGIPESKMPQLFNAFTQLHDTRRRRSGGTGLGLAICKRLTEALRGKLTVSSQAGRGSEFTLRLPVSEEEALRLIQGPIPSSRQAEEPSGSRDPSLQGVHVLLVDDNPDNQRIVAFLLEHVGATVDCADDGRQGVDRFFAQEERRMPYDVVLMDMQMPVLDGYGATSELRRRGVTTPVVALTAYAMAGDAQRCLQAGCTAYLPKPIVPGDLYKVIRQNVSPRKTTSATVPAALRGALSNPALVPLITRFVQRLPERKNRMEAALAAGNSDELRVAVHSLRGTGASFGFPDLSTLSGEAEDAIRGGKGADEVMGRVQALFAAIDQALTQAELAGLAR